MQFPRGHFPPGALSGNVFSWFMIYIVCHTYTFTVGDTISQGALPPWSSLLKCILLIYDLYSTSCLHLYGWQCNFLGGTSSLESLLECFFLFYDLYRIPDYTFSSMPECVFSWLMKTQIDWTEGFEINTYKLVCFYFKSFGSVLSSPLVLNNTLNSMIYIATHTCTFTVDDAISQGALPPWSCLRECILLIYDLYSVSCLHLCCWQSNFPGGASPLELSPEMYSADLWFI